jgi:predicted nucleotidyltransferase
MSLNENERRWLALFKESLQREFPGSGAKFMVYGSKARGDDGPHSDLDILVLIFEGDSETKRKIRHLGHILALAADTVPSILVYTQDEWSSRERSGSFFCRAVMRDGVAA